MATDPPPPFIRGGHKKAVLAAAAVAVLSVGFLLAPPRSMSRPSEERVAPILEEQIEQRDPLRVLRGAQETGRRVAVFVVELRPAGDPARPEVSFDVALAERTPPRGGFGLLLPGGRVVTHLDALDGDVAPVVVTSAGEARGRLAAADAATGLALVLLSGAEASGAELSAAVPEAGTLAVAAARPGGLEVVAPLILASASADRLTLTAASGITRPGMPIFTAAGSGIAIAAGPREPATAYLIAPALVRLEARSGGSGASTLGLALQAPSESLARTLGEGGVPIADVRAGSPAEAAGLRPGDVLVSIAGEAVATVESARRAITALAPGAGAPLEVRRGGRRLTVTARPEVWRPRPPRTAAGTEGVPARDLFTARTLAALRLPPGARVTAVDGGPPPARALEVTAWRRRRAASVVQVEAPQGRYLVAVGPER